MLRPIISSRRLLLRQPRTALLSSEASASATETPASRERGPKPQAIEGSVPFISHHFLVVETRMTEEQWPQKLERSDHLVGSYCKAINSVETKRGASVKTSPMRASAARPYLSCGQESESIGTVESDDLAHDLLIFPDNVRVHGVKPANIPTLVERVLGASEDVRAVLKDLELPHSTMDDGLHMFVCTHGNRDFRCACAGPQLLGWLKEIAEEKKAPLHLWSASHYGGHRYAGNCVVYPHGEWFGLLNAKEDAEAMVDAMLDNEPLRLKDKWRGRLLTDKEQQIELLKQAAEVNEATA